MSAAQNATNLKSFNRFQGLINQMRGVTLLILEPDDKGQWRFVHCSPDFTEASGIAKERLLGCTLDDLFPDIITDEAELTKMREALQFCLLQKLHFSITQHLIFNPSKVETWWRSTLNPVLDESGNPVMILYCAVEITEQKQSELLLQQSEYKFRSVINDQTEMIVRWLPGGIRTFVNKAYCDEFKIEPKEALGSSFFDLIEPSDRQLVEHRISKLSPENPVSTAMHEVVLLNGEKGWQEWTDRAFYDEKGEIVDYQSTGRNITDRVLSEQRTIQQIYDKIEAERSRISNDLHDGLGQVLTAALLSARSLGMGTKSIDSIKAELIAMLDSAMQESRLIAYNLIPASLETYGLKSSLKDLLSHLEKSTGIRCEFDSNVRFIRFDTMLERHVYRIAQEAINNSIKHAEPSMIRLQLKTGPKWIRMNISDNGKGFDRELKAADLKSIQNRLRLIQGQLEVKSSKTWKTIIGVKIPC